MPKETSLEKLAYQVLEGNKGEGMLELMLAIPEHMAEDDDGHLLSPKMIAANILSSSEQPPPSADRNTEDSDHEYFYEGAKQVREGEAQILAEDISLLKRKSDMQDVLLKIAGENKALAEETARNLTLIPGLGDYIKPKPLNTQASSFAESVGGQLGPHAGRERAAGEKYKELKLSPDAQKVYDEYKAKGFSPTLKYQESPE